MNQKIKIAVIADLHYMSYSPGNTGKQQGYFADIMLLRTVHRLNRFIKPDITLILGDLVDTPAKPRSGNQLRTLREIIDKLESPAIVIPGNHDPAPDIFYQTMPRPPDQVDIKGVRFLPFIDRQTENFNAHRAGPDIARFKTARDNFTGRIVSVQHVPIFPPGAHACPYNYINAPEIIRAMQENRIGLSISGHYHQGFEFEAGESADIAPARFLAAPALCDAPFQFMVIEIDGDNITTAGHALANPRDLALTDYHVHTSYAYCNENMDICQSLKLGRLFGLAHMVFSEHSGQLYYSAADYWSGKCMESGHDCVRHDRMEEYFRETSELTGDYATVGLELDCDTSGYPLFFPEHRHLPRLTIGAIHYLPSLKSPQPDNNKIQDEFLGLVERFSGSGIAVLAHPLRIFKKQRLPVTANTLKRLVELLHANNVAAELNFHTNEPSPEFFRMCIASGVKIAFGSDAHNLYEIGEFFPHLDFLRNTCGYDGDMRDITPRNIF